MAMRLRGIDIIQKRLNLENALNQTFQVVAETTGCIPDVNELLVPVVPQSSESIIHTFVPMVSIHLNDTIDLLTWPW